MIEDMKIPAYNEAKLRAWAERVLEEAPILVQPERHLIGIAKGILKILNNKS